MGAEFFSQACVRPITISTSTPHLPDLSRTVHDSIIATTTRNFKGDSTAMNPPASRSPLGQPTQSRSTSHSPPDLPPAYDPRGAFPEAQLAQPAGLAKTWDEKGEEEREVVPGSIGLLPDDVYERTIGPWRAWLRRVVSRTLEWESHAIAAMQVRSSPRPV